MKEYALHVRRHFLSLCELKLLWQKSVADKHSEVFLFCAKLMTNLGINKALFKGNVAPD